MLYKTYFLPLAVLTVALFFMVYFQSSKGSRGLAVVILLILVHLFFCVAQVVTGQALADTSPPMKLRDEDYTRIAYHEAGHAVVLFTLTQAFEDCDEVSMTDGTGEDEHAKSGRGGWNKCELKTGSLMLTREDLIAYLASFCGGRIAEQNLLGNYTGSALEDIANATDFARTMVMSGGIGGKEGDKFVAYNGIAVSEATMRDLELRVEALLAEAYQMAEEVLKGRNHVVERVGKVLLEKRKLSREEVVQLIQEAEATPVLK